MEMKESDVTPEFSTVQWDPPSAVRAMPPPPPATKQTKTEGQARVHALIPVGSAFVAQWAPASLVTSTPPTGPLVIQTVAVGQAIATTEFPCGVGFCQCQFVPTLAALPDNGSRAKVTMEAQTKGAQYRDDFTIAMHRSTAALTRIGPASG